MPVRASTIASEARSPSVWGLGASVVPGGSWVVVGPAPVTPVVELAVVAVGLKVTVKGSGIEGLDVVVLAKLEVVRDVEETAELLDGITDVDDDCTGNSEEEDGISVVVVLGSVDVAGFEVDVVVVGSGCVVVVMDDVGKFCVVDGSLVGGSVLVVVVSSHVVTVLLSVVDVASSVVVVGGSVVVGLVVLVAAWVVGTTAEAFVSRSY